MENKIKTERYKIPQDVLIDILRILFGNNIKHSFEGVKEKENLAILKVYFTIGSTNNVHAKENIENILQDYATYMSGLMNDTVLYMDEEDEN